MRHMVARHRTRGRNQELNVPVTVTPLPSWRDGWRPAARCRSGSDVMHPDVSVKDHSPSQTPQLRTDHYALPRFFSFRRAPNPTACTGRTPAVPGPV